MEIRRRPWDGIVSHEEIKRYDVAGFGRPLGMGKRPALLIIDVQYRTVGTEPKPFFDAIGEFPTSCGEVGWEAVGNIQKLLAAFRAENLPILYPHVAPKMAYDAGRLASKVPSIMGISEKGYQFVAEVAPREGDILIPKRHPSAFFATSLASYLVELQIDTLFLTGCTTSGCVRGTAVDAFSYNFRVIIPEECVYDRSPVCHAVNLFDMSAKYADVVTLSESVGLLRTS